MGAIAAATEPGGKWAPRMQRLPWRVVGALLLAAGMALSAPAQADFELTAPDGRRIQLKDDGTWKYADATVKDRSADKADSEAVLQLERKTEGDRSCRFELVLVNNLPYEIRSLVPQFSAYRENGVLYETISAKSSFAMLKPGRQAAPRTPVHRDQLQGYRQGAGRRRRPLHDG